MSILKIHAREIFDSRGNPTVEVDLYTDRGDSPWHFFPKRDYWKWRWFSIQALQAEQILICWF